jgi:hypothetical protein
MKQNKRIAENDKEFLSKFKEICDTGVYSPVKMQILYPVCSNCYGLFSIKDNKWVMHKDIGTIDATKQQIEDIIDDISKDCMSVYLLGRWGNGKQSELVECIHNAKANSWKERD